MGNILKRGVLVLVVLPTILICSCDSDLLPQALASDIQTSVEKSKIDSNKVFEEIQRNIDLAARLQQEVQQARLSGEVVSLESIIKDLTVVTESYEQLSKERSRIESRLLKRASVVQDMRTRVYAEIEILRLRQIDYLMQISQIGNIDSEVSRLHRKSLSKAVGYIDLQIQLWIDFDKTDQAILLEMDKVRKRIDSFLGAISGSAIVFREGLNLLQLQQSIDEALSLFDRDIPRMDQLQQDMEDSWSTLDYLVSNLTSLEIPVVSY